MWAKKPIVGTSLVVFEGISPVIIPSLDKVHFTFNSFNSLYRMLAKSNCFNDEGIVVESSFDCVSIFAYLINLSKFLGIPKL